MKTISAALDAHLRQEVTTLCTCWKIIRTDGEVFGFTDHDRDIVWGGLTYESETGYNRTAITGDESFSVDNLDVTGFLESDRISENDLRNGLFDNAKLFIFALNWADTSMNAIPLRRGWFGEVILKRNGSFETEVRGLHQALAVSFMESYQPDCRTDFCSDKCKLNYTDYVRTGFAFHPLSRSQFLVSVGSYTAPVDSVGAHRFWKLAFDTTSSQAVMFEEIAFFDQDGKPIPGGAVNWNSNQPFHPGSDARDGNPATVWLTWPIANAWWTIDFGAGHAKDVSGFSLTVHDSVFPEGIPFHLLYSDDGVTWTNASDFLQTGWTAHETRTFMKHGELPTVGTPIAPPTTGATTYVSGTIKFTSGPNTGKTIEIVDYDPATGLVTVFEEFPYEVSGGDLLEVAQGCDKMFDTCKLYGNQLNFRGEPHVPGQDSFLSYPDAQE